MIYRDDMVGAAGREASPAALETILVVVPLGKWIHAYSRMEDKVEF